MVCHAVIVSVLLTASLVFSGGEWWLPVLSGWALALVLVMLSCRRSGTAGRICGSLRAVGFTLLLLCLLEPTWIDHRARPGANYAAILADNSQGMRIHNAGEDISRGESLREFLLDGPPGWQEALEERFQVRRYQFDTRLEGVRDFGGLQFDGRATGLGHALRSLARRFEGQPLAGIILFSDGNATDWVEGEFDWTGLPPIHPILSGTDERVRDIAIGKVTVTETDFEDAPITLTAKVDADGFAASEVRLSLDPLSPGEEEVPGEEQFREADAERSVLDYRFQFRPEPGRVSFYRLEARPVPGDEETREESTLANNRRVVAVDRGGGPHRILYVAGRPNWEYKFLRRAMEEDDQIQLVGLVRIADRAPRFEFKGRPGETSNPLYRGFDKQDELTEQYDQAVMTRLNIRDVSELVGGFPRKAEDLYEYKAVIVDDLEASFFTTEQMSLLQRYVSERGGGFLALGGYKSLVDGDYEGTPVGDMLPVYLDIRDDRPVGEVRMRITREGMLEPWMRLRPTESQERDRLASLVPFRVLSRVGRSKPGAVTLMEVREEGTGEIHPGLVVQRYGRGKTAALMIGDLWRWQMHDREGTGEHGRAWRQLVRWLAGDVPESIELSFRRVPADPNQAMSIEVRVRDGEFLPMENAEVRLEVETVSLDGEVDDLPAELVAEASAEEPGLYQARYIPRQAGGYAVKASVADADGLTVGTQDGGWSSDPAAAEFRSPVPNRALMEELARRTGGTMVERDGLERLVEELMVRDAPVMEPWRIPLWNTPWIFLLALACFVLEWGIRRARGLA